MRTPSIALAAAALLAATSADARTSFYSRQTLPNLSQAAYTYAATYGSFGSCSNGVQTAPVASCTRSDGQTVANSSCSPKTQTCTAGCGDLAQKSGVDGNYVNGDAKTVIHGDMPLASAKTWCNSNSGGKRGVCVWSANTAYFYTGFTLAPAGNTTYGSSCGQ